MPRVQLLKINACLFTLSVAWPHLPHTIVVCFNVHKSATLISRVFHPGGSLPCESYPLAPYTGNTEEAYGTRSLAYANSIPDQHVLCSVGQFTCAFYIKCVTPMALMFVMRTGRHAWLRPGEKKLWIRKDCH